MPISRTLLMEAIFPLAAASILISLFTQIWVPAVHFRRFSRIFGDRPQLQVEAFNRVFLTFGWRARLAVKLFRIPIPPGVSIQQ